MELNLVKDYVSGLDIYSICYKYKVGKIKVKDILNKHGIEIRKRGGQKLNKPYVVNDYSIEKFPIEEGYHYVAVHKESGYETMDYMNKGGKLSTYIRNYNKIDIPSLYDRREYYKLTGNYWFEQFFDIIKVKNVDTKKCPFCEWCTIDVNNNSGAFEKHLLLEHNITKYQYIEQFPKEKEYFELSSETLNRQFETDKDKFVQCAICGKKLRRIDSSHLIKHNITKEEYIALYGKKTVCNELHDMLSDNAIQFNINSEYSFKSKSELEIIEYIKQLGFDCYSDRKILNGKELDIYVPSKKLAIEFNGNLWHTEKFGKDKYYHVNKTNCCEDIGIKLIQIFEDEYINHKEIVLSMLSNNLGLNKVINIDDVEIKFIDNITSINFLNENGLEVNNNIDYSIGVYNQNKELICVVSFSYKVERYKMTNYVYKCGYNCDNIFKHIINMFMINQNISEVDLLFDRRFYNKIDLVNIIGSLHIENIIILEPTYNYFSPSVNRLKRFNKEQKIENINYDIMWNCGYLNVLIKI